MPTALETAIQAQITPMTDAIRKALAQEKLTEYIAARAALSAAAGNSLISYSRAGFSATKMRPDEFRRYVQEIESELAELIYGNITLQDHGARAEWSSYPQ